jgi:hypothetical protein
MSREERRAYQRMTRKQDPYALPGGAAAKARQERQRAKRPPRPAPTTVGGFGVRFLLVALGGGAAAGLLAFSLAWPTMPLAAYVGVGVAAAWIVAAFGLRLLGRRAAAGR